jgi:tetratricopeptide (TPR) repeat protein
MLAAALLLAAAAPAALPVDTEASRYRACLATAGAEPKVAITEATKWLGAGGGIPARHCLALAYLADRQFAPATLTLTQAARAAEAAKAPQAAALWSQAGNAALAGGDANQALGYFTTSLAAGATAPENAATLIDRARAFVELKRDKEARASLDASLALDPAPGAGWLLRATLERRGGDLGAAERDILAAAQRGPDDADVSLEAGNIAALQGKLDLARQAWTAAMTFAPGSPAGVAANEALTANPAAKP